MTLPTAVAHPDPSPIRRTIVRATGPVLALMLLAAGCGGGGSGDDETGGVVVRDISVETVDGSDIAATEPAEADSDDADDSADADADAAEETLDDEATDTPTTLPQADEDSPQDDLFAAVGEFQSCMEAEGVEFIGAPDASLGTDAPQNQQPYIDSLILCATRSDIQNKVAAAQAAQAELTPEEVEDQNRTFLAFRDCMIGRGWIIPMPTPNENGLLFSFAVTADWEGPPGEDLIDSDNASECQDEAGVGDDDE